MSQSHGRLSLKRALGLSMVLHLALASLLTTTATLAVGSADRFAGIGSTETTSVSFLTIERRSRAVTVAPHTEAPHEARPPDVPRPAHARVRAAARRTSAPLAAREGTPAQAAAASRARNAIPRVALALATTAPERTDMPVAVRTAAAKPPAEAADAGAAVRTPLSASASPAAAAPAQLAESSAHGVDVPPGGWGQSFDKPLVADEAALADIRSRYHAGTAVTIDVDEAGHATHVTLPSGLPDDVRAEIERRLREMRYVPAECNGLRCVGTLQITI